MQPHTADHHRSRFPNLPYSVHSVHSVQYVSSYKTYISCNLRVIRTSCLLQVARTTRGIVQHLGLWIKCMDHPSYTALWLSSTHSGPFPAVFGDCLDGEICRERHVRWWPLQEFPCCQIFAEETREQSRIWLWSQPHCPPTKFCKTDVKGRYGVCYASG